MNGFSTFFRRCSKAFWYSLVILLVVIAVIVSFIRIFLPGVNTYRDTVERLASEYLGQQVKISSFDAKLVGLTPTFILKDIRMIDHNGRELVRFYKAKVGIAVFSSLRLRQPIPDSLTVVGIKLAITRRRDDTLQIQGFKIKGLDQTIKDKEVASNQLAHWLFNRVSLKLEDSIILWRDLRYSNKPLRFSNINIHLKNSGDRHMLNAEWSLPKSLGKHSHIAVDISGNVLNLSSWSGKLYFHVNGLKIDNIGFIPELFDFKLQRGQVNFKLWSELTNGQLRRLDGVIETTGIELTRADPKNVIKADRLDGAFAWQRTPQGWSLGVDRLKYIHAKTVWPLSRFNVTSESTAGNPSAIKVSADKIRLQDVSGLLLSTQLLDASLNRKLKALKPSGYLNDFFLTYQFGVPFPNNLNLRTQFSTFSINSLEKFPGIQNLSGTVWANKTDAMLQIESHDVSIKLPRLFRNTITMSELKAAIELHHIENAWHIHSPHVVAWNKDVSSVSNFLIMIPDSKLSPYMDLQVNFEQADVSQKSLYLPVGIMLPQIVKWVDQSIISGRVIRGGAVFNGRLNDFPFNPLSSPKGKFLVQFYTDDMVLDYQQGWPRIEKIKSNVVFTSLGMSIDSSSAKLIDSKITNTQVKIPIYMSPRLHIIGDVRGDTNDVLKFLMNSPIGDDNNEFIQSIRTTGSSITKLDIALPLSYESKKLKPLKYSGSVALKDSAFYLLGDTVDVTQVNGTLTFGQQGQYAKDIKAKIFGNQATLSVYPAIPGDPSSTRITAQGEINPVLLSKRINIPGLQTSKGNTKWHGQLSFAHKQKDKNIPTTLRVTSDLKGVALDLPAPLNKNANSRREFVLGASIYSTKSFVTRMKYANEVSAVLSLTRINNTIRVKRGSIWLGGGQAKFPKNRILMINGDAKNVSFGKWWQLFDHYSSGNDRHGISSDIFNIPLVIDLKTLYITKPDRRQNDNDDNAADPRKLPAIRGIVQQLHYKDLNLGQVKFRISKHPRGVKLDNLDINSPLLKLSTEGDWTYRRGKHTSIFNAVLKTEDLGAMLNGFGIASTINEGTADGKLSLYWNAAPKAFSLAKLSGTMEFNIEDGTFVDIDPGARKLFGLLSLSALPRRLLLDFRDISEEGFSFDEINGTFQIRGGNAYTNDLEITSTIADVSLRGRTGLAKQDFDQLVTVTPKIGDSLAGGGAIIIGPQVGIITWILDKIFNFGKAIEQEYQITGTWKDPVITRFGAEMETESPNDTELSDDK